MPVETPATGAVAAGPVSSAAEHPGETQATTPPPRAHGVPAAAPATGAAAAGPVTSAAEQPGETQATTPHPRALEIDMDMDIRGYPWISI